jgi:hypothetical protein
VASARYETDRASLRYAGWAFGLANVVGITGHLKAAGVFGLRAHADIMKCVVAEKAAGMTDIATAVIENALAALFGSTEWNDLLDRRRMASDLVERSFKSCDGFRDSHRSHVSSSKTS